MSAYAGYTKPSYGAQGGEDSGGFFAGGSQTGSQGGGKSYQDESLRPVTIKQILEAEEAFSGADFKIDGSPVTQITFVGQVRSVNPQPTNITFKIDDGTGQIEVKKWIDADKQDEADPGFEVDSHVRVWGRLKSFSSKRHVGAHVIRPVADYNEVNYHLLEATYRKLSGCTLPAKKMFNYMSNTPGGNEGMHLNVVTQGTSMTTRDVLNAADELLGQGLIYTTVDDETWAILEY
ncbi:hypothetical protein HIM_00558 [Hirsutella minnesotensis 3608]|nr:hypothetical protein HIM_00558 [Hirsutella minnesotensis 3608]